MPSQETTTYRLASRLQAARAGSFVGRQTEVELFRSALAAETPDFAVLHLHGPGGVGKSALLARYAAEADDAGRRTVMVDARDADPTPAGVLAALSTGLGAEADDPLATLAAEPRPVVLVDTYELLRPVDDWVRTTLVPQLPLRSLVVLAGRHPPGPGWRRDPAWDDLLRVVALRDLPADEARALLERRGVPASRHSEVLDVAHGHPLALVLVADVLDQHGDEPFRLGDVPEVLERLLGRLLTTLPSDAHRRALYATAVAGVATEPLLHRVLEPEVSHEVFDWMRTLSVTAPSTTGIALHDLVAETLDAELRWRDPDGYTQLHGHVVDHHVDRVLGSSGPDQDRAMLDLLHLYRRHPITRQFFDSAPAGMWLQPAGPDDHDAIVAMTRAHEGEVAAAVARHWLEQQPDAFSVFLTASSNDPAGFVAHLTLEDAPTDDILEADPVVAAVWEHVRRQGPLRRGERIRIMRFWIDRATHQGPETFPLASARATLDYLVTPALAWAFGVVGDPDIYEPMFAFSGFEHVPTRVDVGDHRVGMFARDMREMSIQAWWDLLGRRMVTPTAHVDQLPRPTRRHLVLAQDDFATAVREALRGLARPGGLDGNPLLQSRVVLDVVEDDDDAAAGILAELLERAMAELTDHPRDHKLHRALDRTYVRPAPTQEAAAEVLGLPFSTFRRHLRAGIDHVTAWLWERELHGHPRTGSHG